MVTQVSEQKLQQPFQLNFAAQHHEGRSLLTKFVLEVAIAKIGNWSQADHQ